MAFVVMSSAGAALAREVAARGFFAPFFALAVFALAVLVGAFATPFFATLFALPFVFFLAITISSGTPAPAARLMP